MIVTLVAVFSQSGELSYEEFLEMIRSPDNMLATSLFKLIDADGSGTVDFSEFFRVLATYCMFSKEEILRFTFDTFDKDGSGTLDEKEFSTMCVVINNELPTFPGNFKKALREFDKSGDGLIDFSEFRDISNRFPMLTHIAFRLQDQMQKFTLGEQAWTNILKHRRKTRLIEEFKAQNQGALPAEKLCERISRYLFGSRTKRE